MVAKKKEELKTYRVKVKDNPGYCGEDHGGPHIKNKISLITSDRLAAWFREHEGYTVEEVEKPEESADV